MWSRHRLEGVTALVAAVLGGCYLLLPPMGSDLAAQVARAGFWAEHGWTPIDLRWYAGVDQLGYSLLSQPVMALLGVRVTGAVSVVVGAVLLAVLFRRTGAARPWLGATAGVLGMAGNLISGRVTYGIGVCLGLAAIVALTSPRRRPLAAVFTLLAGAASPVAALFLGLAGVALLLAGPNRPELAGAAPPPAATLPTDTARRGPVAQFLAGRGGAGLLLAVPAAVPLALTALLFGDGGWMNISRDDATRAAVTALVVAALVPLRAVRLGGLLTAAGVLAAFLIRTPVGLNATRLTVMFALPVLAAYAALPTRTERRTPVWLVVALLAAVFWWHPPVVSGDVRGAGSPTASPDYFAPLRERLARENVTGRVEVPSTRDYWEAAHLGDLPLARGWLRQADIDRNPLFFTEVPGARGTGVTLDAGSYRAWLDEQAVQFVAVPDAEFAWPGRAEAQLIDGGLSYLKLIWSDPHWRLYAVTDPRPIVAAPATLVRQGAAVITLDVPRAGDVPVRVRHHRWLTASGGAEVARDGVWTVLRVPRPGRYTLSSRLF